MFCNDLDELVCLTINERGLDPSETTVLVGLDQGQGSLKVAVTLVNRKDGDEKQNRSKYSQVRAIWIIKSHIKDWSSPICWVSISPPPPLNVSHYKWTAHTVIHILRVLLQRILKTPVLRNFFWCRFILEFQRSTWTWSRSWRIWRFKLWSFL